METNLEQELIFASTLACQNLYSIIIVLLVPSFQADCVLPHIAAQGILVVPEAKFIGSGPKTGTLPFPPPVHTHSQKIRQHFNFILPASRFFFATCPCMTWAANLFLTFPNQGILLQLPLQASRQSVHSHNPLTRKAKGMHSWVDMGAAAASAKNNKRNHCNEISPPPSLQLPI